MLRFEITRKNSQLIIERSPLAFTVCLVICLYFMHFRFQNLYFVLHFSLSLYIYTLLSLSCFTSIIRQIELQIHCLTNYNDVVLNDQHGNVLKIL